MHTRTRESRKYIFPESVQNLNERSRDYIWMITSLYPNDIEHACTPECKMIYKQMIARDERIDYFS